MKIEEMKMKEVFELQRQMAELFGSRGASPAKTHSFEVGKQYFIRTVTHHYTGKLISVTDTDLVLVDAAWIADDGRFSEAISQGKHNEVEPYPDGLPVIIGRGVLVDACEYKAALPRSQK